jgi:hypothetical protein
MDQDELTPTTACSVCRHPDVADIDAALVGGTSRRAVSERFGIGASSVQRHKTKHLAPSLVQAMRSEPSHAAGLLDRIEALIDRVERLVDAAEADGKPGLMLSGVKEMRALLELLGKATGELKGEGTSITLNVLTSEEWLRIQSAVVGAVAPYPDARAAVSTALLELGPGRD